MPWLCVESYNDEQQVTIAYFPPRENKRGFTRLIRFIEITDDDAKLGIDLLTRIFSEWINTGTLPKVIQQIANPKSGKSSILDTIIGIIKTSNFSGERENAMRVYEQITGEPYRG